jgi:hypothetical protein
VTERQPLASAQLIVYGFGPGAEFEGRLVGALERIEAGGALRILEALFVRRDSDGDGLEAFDLRGRGGGGITAPLLSFRLEPAARRRATEKALAGVAGVSPDTLRALADALDPGAALAAVLVEHVWARALEDAAMRTGGTLLATEHGAGSVLAELTPSLLASVGGRSTSTGT